VFKKTGSIESEFNKWNDDIANNKGYELID